MLLSPIYEIIDIHFNTRTCGQIKEIVAYDLFLEFVVFYAYHHSLHFYSHILF